MSNNELLTMCHQYKELQRIREELAEELEALADSIKAAMGDSEMVRAGEYKITHKTITGSRLDSTAFRRECPELAARFTVPTASKRFQIL